MDSTLADTASFSSRIFVDLSYFYKDYRKQCCLHLDKYRFKTVSDVKLHCVQHFSIVGDVQLLLDDCLLLDNDNIQVLRDGDCLRLINPQSYTNGERDSPDKNRNDAQTSVRQSRDPICVGNNIDSSTACYKTEVSSLKSSEKNKKSAKKLEDEKTQEDVPSVLGNGIALARKAGVSDRLFGKNKCESMTQETSKQNDIQTENGEQDMDVVYEGEVNWDLLPPLPKRKRNRRRKNKKPLTNSTSTPPLEILVPEPAPVTIKHHPNRRHIRFDETISSGDTVTDYSQQQKEASDHEDVQIAFPVDFSDLLSRKSPVVYQRQRSPEQKNEHWVQLTEGEIWENPAVTKPPMVDEVIAFKVLCLGADYTPQLSPWIIGQVTYEQRDDTKLKLAILRGLNPFIRDLEGKFEVDNEVEDQDKNNISIPWDEMVTPRKLTH